MEQNIILKDEKFTKYTPIIKARVLVRGKYLVNKLEECKQIKNIFIITKRILFSIDVLIIYGETTLCRSILLYPLVTVIAETSDIISWK